MQPDVCALLGWTDTVFRDEVVRLLMGAHDQGRESVLLMVACLGGIHRGVAVGEIIRKKLLQRGVTSVHVRHAHWQRLPGDAI